MAHGEIAGRCWFVRDHGAWMVIVEGPCWVIDEMTQEFYAHGFWLHNHCITAGSPAATAAIGACLDMGPPWKAPVAIPWWRRLLRMV